MSRDLVRDEATALRAASQNFPRKLYYKIGEVCEITGLTAHVLRYWEKEFPQLAPRKTASGHRLYREKDIRSVLLIKELLYDRKFTIRGAREFLASGARETNSASATQQTATPGARAGLIQERLAKLRALLERKAPL